MKRMETSGSLMDVESKDQSSSLGAEVMDGRIMEDDEVEEIFTAENISVDEAGVGRSLSSFLHSLYVASRFQR